MSSPEKRTFAESLRLLVELQDLDLMIKEAAVQEEKDLGFKIEDVSKLQEARQNLAMSIDPVVLRIYERLLRRYERAVAPVHGGICLGCFMTLPTALCQSVQRHQGVSLCENCGRILYWLGGEG